MDYGSRLIRPSAGPEPHDLTTAYGKLYQLILEGVDVIDFLRQVSMLAGTIVPRSHCGITLQRGEETVTVTDDDEVYLWIDERQHLLEGGPCLEAMQMRQRVEVPDMTVEQRWGSYPEGALANGVLSVVALPLVVDGHSVGAISLFGDSSRAFADLDISRAQDFAQQVATGLAIFLRQSSWLTLDAQLHEAVRVRAVIDQAIGVLMHAHKLAAREAFEMLRSASQSSNRKVSLIAADVIRSMTGHPHEAPRPLSDCGSAIP